MYCGYAFKPATPDEGHVTVCTFCPNDHKRNEVVMTVDQFKEYREAASNPRSARHIQDILPDKEGFTPEQREYLITGLCHDCQEEVFASPFEDEEDEDENENEEEQEEEKHEMK